MIDLGHTTLTALIYNHSPEHLERTLRVMRYMQNMIKFNSSILFSATPVCADCENRLGGILVQIPPTDSHGAQTFQIKVLPHFIRTPWMMVVHDDGFVLDPSLWKPEFLCFDFIGSPWGDNVVGNEGFSIQSSRFLQLKAALPRHVDTTQADEYVCREHRWWFDQYGMRFAPREIAEQFSTETTGHEHSSFGFHGRTHNPEKYKLAWERLEAFEKSTNESTMQS